MPSRSTHRRSTPIARRSALAACAACAVALAACSDPAAPPQCVVTVDRLPLDLVVAGTQVQVAARAQCDRGAPPALRWSVSDTTVAAVDAAGLVTGRSPGDADLTVTAVGATGAGASIPLHVETPFDLILSPRRLELLPRVRQPLNLSVVPTGFGPRGFPSTVEVRTSDSCVAVVDAQGIVTAGRSGTATLSVRLTAAPGVRDSVQAVVAVPAAARTVVVSLTDVATGGAADPRALRGRISAVVNFLYPTTGGRIELRLGGRVAATLLLAEPWMPSVAVARLPVVFDTEARDAAGARRFPVGPQTLEAALVVPDVPGLPGCAAFNLGEVDSRPVTVIGG